MNIEQQNVSTAAPDHAPVVYQRLYHPREIAVSGRWRSTEHSRGDYEFCAGFLGFFLLQKFARLN